MSAVILSQLLNPGVTLAVDDVAPAEEPISTGSLADNLTRRFARKIHVLPDPDQAVAKTSIGRCHPPDRTPYTPPSASTAPWRCPNALWLVIAQGFRHHVAANAESLRPQLARHTKDASK